FAESNEHKHFYYSVRAAYDVTEQHQYRVQFIDREGKANSPTQLYSFVYNYLAYQPLASQVLRIGSLTEKSHTMPSGVEVTNITPLTEVRAEVLDEAKHWRIISLLSLSPSM